MAPLDLLGGERLLGAISLRARYSKETEGALPAFIPVVIVSFGCDIGTVDALALSRSADVSMSSLAICGRRPSAIGCTATANAAVR